MNPINKTILIFGSLSIAILLLFQLQHWSLFALGHSQNLLPILFAILFIVIGTFLGKYLYLKKRIKEKELVQSSLSKQELNVLRLIAEGNSNKEIADKLFIAETTVKSHVSKVLIKLNAKRRTEAIKIGKELHII